MTIDDDTFHSTPLLTDLSLAENRLGHVTGGTLAPLTHLYQLALDGNRFKVYRHTSLYLYFLYNC